jgi:hypothetical protein
LAPGDGMVYGPRSTVHGLRPALPIAETSTVEGGRESRDPLLQRMYQAWPFSPRSPVAGRRPTAYGLRTEWSTAYHQQHIGVDEK